MAGHFNYSNNQMYYSSGDQMYMRSRAGSGSSESSRGSGSSGSGKSRRRSHRPRGCRGGSNRRKNNGGEGKKKASFKTAYNSDLQSKRGVRGNKFAYNGSMNPPTFLDGEAPYSKQIPELNTCNGMPYNDSNGDFGYDPQDFYHPQGGNNHYYTQSFPQQNELGMDYPAIPNSFSDSSQDTFNEPLFDQGNFGARDEEQILPPMPPNSFQEPRPLPTGPNPYALNLSVSTSSTYIPCCNINPLAMEGPLPPTNPAFPPPFWSATRPPPPGILQPLNHTKENNNIQNQFSVVDQGLKRGEGLMETYSFESSSCTDSYLEHPAHDAKNQKYEYRAERLEKQRQNVEGGSLFVTSPRSFLMGMKKSFHTSSAATVASG